MSTAGVADQIAHHLAEPQPHLGAQTRPGIVVSITTSVYLDGQKAVLHRSKMNPSLGRNFEAMDPLEWLARLADHIPDAGRHRTHFYGFYSSRVRSCTLGFGVRLAASGARQRRCGRCWHQPAGATHHVGLLLTEEGVSKLARLTKQHVGRHVARLMDGRLVSYPRLAPEITKGRAVINGDFSETEARDVAAGIVRP